MPPDNPRSILDSATKHAHERLASICNSLRAHLRASPSNSTGTVVDSDVDNRAYNTFSFLGGRSRLLSFMFMYVLPIQDALMR